MFYFEVMLPFIISWSVGSILDELAVGNPENLSVDVGPVIDAEARETIARHVQAMREAGHAGQAIVWGRHDLLGRPKALCGGAGQEAELGQQGRQ